jgi:diguanylate cyclase (GGDEF)-like protein
LKFQLRLECEVTLDLPYQKRKPVKRHLEWMLTSGPGICVFLIDYITNPVVDLYAIYLIPALLAVWFIGQFSGLVFLIVGNFCWTYVDLIRRPDLQFWVMIVNSALRAGVFLALLWSVSRLRAMNGSLSELSLSDELTGLPNRHALRTRGEIELQRIRRGKAPLSVMFIDVDDFKKVNDTQGHDAGDILIEDIADMLNHGTRITDFVARLGGDEFVALFPEIDGKVATQLAAKIKNSAKAVLARYKTPLSLSIGIATFNRAETSFDTVLSKADRLMYEVKSHGKDGILQKDL